METLPLGSSYGSITDLSSAFQLTGPLEKISWAGPASWLVKTIGALEPPAWKMLLTLCSESSSGGVFICSYTEEQRAGIKVGLYPDSILSFELGLFPSCLNVHASVTSLGMVVHAHLNSEGQL